MNRLLRSDLETLVEERQGPCVSIYFSTFHSGARRHQGPIRLRNLLRRAHAELQLRSDPGLSIETLLTPLATFEDDVLFWAAQEEGAALFCSPGFSRAYRLPRPFPERLAIGDHFVIKPLLPLVAADDVFYVLALSQNQVRLLEATSRTVERLAVPDLPGSLTEALGEVKTAQYLQYHTASAASGGALPAIYHGHGVGAGDTKEELRRFLRPVEAAVRKRLAGCAAPCVLAGAEPLPFLYQEISRIPHLAASVIAGNPEHLRDDELRDRAWQLLEPTFAAERRRAAERFGELAGTGQASNDVTEVLPAARQGRVEALFLACDSDLWGRLDERPGQVSVHAAPEEGDLDLLDAAAVFSLRSRSAVYGVELGEVPGGGKLAAVFRY
jgi:release factor family 3